MASFVLGLLSLLCTCFTALPGLICGLVGLANISKSQGRLKGKGLALLGILLSLFLPVAGSVIGYFLFQKPIERITVMAHSQSYDGPKVYVAIKEYATTHEGNLPAAFQDLINEGLLHTQDLHTNPSQWTLEHGGEKLDSLAPDTVIASCGPFILFGVPLRTVIYANGTVAPENLPLAPDDALEAP